MLMTRFVDRLGVHEPDVGRCILKTCVNESSVSECAALYAQVLEEATEFMANTMPPLDEKWRVFAKLVGEAHERFAKGPTYAVECNNMITTSQDFIEGNHTKAFMNRLIPFSLLINDDVATKMMHIDNAGQMFAYMALSAYNTEDAATLEEEYQVTAVRFALSAINIGTMFTDDEIRSLVVYPFHTSRLFDKIVGVWSLMWVDENGPMPKRRVLFFAKRFVLQRAPYRYCQTSCIVSLLRSLSLFPITTNGRGGGACFR